MVLPRREREVVLVPRSRSKEVEDRKLAARERPNLSTGSCCGLPSLPSLAVPDSVVVVTGSNALCLR